MKMYVVFFLYFSLDFVGATAREDMGALEVTVNVDIYLYGEGAGDLILRLQKVALKWQPL